MAVHVIYEGNDTIIEVKGLKNEVSGDYINAATVAVTLTDTTGVEVTGETWPLAMSYVTGSNGKYRATLADTLSLTVGTRYEATISANAGAGLQAKWVEQLVCQQRRK